MFVDLNALVELPSATCTEIAKVLDAMSHGERIVATRSLSRGNVVKLFNLAEGYLPVTLNDLVPPTLKPFETIRHLGTNNLAMFRTFEKVLYRLPEGTVAGANFQSMSFVSGPGYFMVREAPRKGEVIFDYSRLPSQAPIGWPKIVSNSRGLSFFIFRNMQDILRRVSEHVTIGQAFRGGKKLPNAFVLVRDIPQVVERQARAA